MPGFHVEHFGCRAARADGEALSARLRGAGLVESDPRAADLVVVNTCSVTAEADRAARAFIRRAHRLNPEARIVVTGCYAQRAPEELASLPGVRAVVGNSHKALAPEIALGLIESPIESRRGFRPAAAGDLVGIAPVPQGAGPSPQGSSGLHLTPAPQGAAAPPQVAQVVWADDRFAHSFLEEAPLVPGTQTRPNLKIQEGCGNRCAFCVIPQTRGPSKSLPAASVLHQVESFVAAGGRELVLSGINLGRWGRDLEAADGLRGRSLAGLVRRIFECTSLDWLRLSSVEPMDWDDELIALMSEFGGLCLCRHAHLPLQSGSDAVLRRMHRRYRPWHYAAKVQALVLAAGPDLTLGADVMVGFPGESDGEFEETLAFLRSLPFGYLHLFPFSPRPGTAGWALHAASAVAAAVVTERMARLRALAAEMVLAHRRSFVGRALPAITLHTPAEVASRGRTAALTENFIPVDLKGTFAANQTVQVGIASVDDEGRMEADENQ
jgi:threonylcarbamoyladenosine tRNA methylthiotransferase MtaB